MKSLLSLLLSFLFLTGFSQQSRRDQIVPVTRNQTVIITKSLEARFTADVTQGTTPLTVKFTDQSTGNPTSWKWAFGDGDSSLLQNPVHVYMAPGIYTVKLTISDGTSGFALEKKDYIKATENLSNCDTLRYPLPEPLTYYYIPGNGYVTGNNSYGDKAISEYFENLQPNLVITGMICEFSQARQVAGNNEKIPVKIWQVGQSSGKPGQLLSSDTLMLSALVNDVANNRISTIDFKEPVQPGSSFFMCIDLPVLSGDTLCLWSTSTGKLPVNTTWILQSDNVWESAQVLWSPPEFIISCALYPKICLLNNIHEEEIPLPFAVWPNPADDFISIVNQYDTKEKLLYSIIDITGRAFLEGSISDSVSTLVDVSMLPPGIYIVIVKGDKTLSSAKIVLR